MTHDNPIHLAKARTVRLNNLLKQIELRSRGGVAPQRHQLQEAKDLTTQIRDALGNIHVQQLLPKMTTAADLAREKNGST
jgi:hypothetical protein